MILSNVKDLTRLSGIIKGILIYKQEIEQLEKLVDKYKKETVKIVLEKEYINIFDFMPKG